MLGEGLVHNDLRESAPCLRETTIIVVERKHCCPEAYELGRHLKHIGGFARSCLARSPPAYAAARASRGMATARRAPGELRQFSAEEAKLSHGHALSQSQAALQNLQDALHLPGC